MSTSTNLFACSSRGSGASPEKDWHIMESTESEGTRAASASPAMRVFKAKVRAIELPLWSYYVVPWQTGYESQPSPSKLRMKPFRHDRKMKMIQFADNISKAVAESKCFPRLKHWQEIKRF